MRPEAEGGLAVDLAIEPGSGREAYRIAFAEDGIVLRASTRTGLLYGLITLGQIWRGARRHPETFLFPAGGEIQDSPAHGWRGSHLDVARQFYSSAEVARFVQLLAWSKMNRFHWHLSDDEAWRVEIDAYPELTRVGAWRGHGLALPPLLGSGPEPQGGYYSKQAIRDLVALADRLGIVVVPEIDIPGHCYAVLHALPHLRDPGEHGEYQSVQGFPNNCLNPAHEPVYGFLETVFDELIALFPSKILHVGADEVPLAAWSGSPLALDRLRRRPAARRWPRSTPSWSNTIGNQHGADAIEGSATAVLQAGVPAAGPALPGLARRRHRRLGGGGAWRRDREGQELPGRLAVGRGQRRAGRPRLRRRRRAGAALLPRHVAGHRLVRAGRRLGRLVGPAGDL